MKLYDAIIKEKGGRIEHDLQPAPHEQPRHEFHKKKQFRLKPFIILAACLVGISGIFLVGVVYGKAKIIVTTKKVPFSLSNATISVAHEKIASSNPLHFQAMVLKGEVSREIVGDKIVESYVKANGRVIFFNEYSSKPTTIKKGVTLIATTGGKKYILAQDVTIPGFKTENGKRVAGTSAPVSVTAQAVGREYNLTGSDFTVSGYTGDKKTRLYARSSGAISGGESGVVHAVAEGDREAAVTILKQLLDEKLKRQARAQIPKGFLTFPNMQFITYDTANVTFQNEQIKFPATLSGTLVLYLFPEEAFQDAVAKKAEEANFGAGKAKGMYTVADMENVTVEPSSGLSINPSEIPEQITLSLEGEGILESKVDAMLLRNTIAGKATGKFESLLEGQEGIAEATYTKFPFWNLFFPNNPESIEIITK